MAWLYVLHVLKIRFWLKNDPVSKPFFVTQFGHYLSTIAHMLDIYLWWLNMYCDVQSQLYGVFVFINGFTFGELKNGFVK